MMKNYILLFLLIIFSCSKQDSLSISKKPLIYDVKSLDSIVNKYIKNYSHALLLVRLEDNNGNSIYQYSNKNNKLVPNHDINENTWFRIWSMSKIATISSNIFSHVGW